MEHEKLSTAFMFLVVFEGCWMLRWLAGRNQVKEQILAAFLLLSFVLAHA